MSHSSSPDGSPVPGAEVDDVWDVDKEWLDLEAQRTAAEEFSARFAGPCGDADVPERFDDGRFADDDLLAMRGPVSAWDLVLLASIDPATLSTEGKLDYLRCVEAVKSMLSAMESRGTVAMAGTDASNSMTDRHVAMEVAALRRVGESAATSGIATARALHVEFPKFLAALSAGEVSEWHCRVLVTETVNVTDPETIAALQDRLLPKARRKTPSEFRRDVRKAVADLDAANEAQRVARARGDRYVACRPLSDGLGYLGIVTDWPTISAMHQRITGAATALKKTRGGAAAVRAGDDDALMDCCRADAAAGLVLGTAQPDGSLEFDPHDIPISLTVVMDLPTLRGEADRHALLDGEPMPAANAREYADAARWWRRVVTDPVTGHALDYGRQQYLPARWRDFVIHRDGCRAPGCTVQAESRLQADHPEPFPAGPTSAANGGGLCIKHHQLKTSRYARIEDSAADGSATWITAWGQRFTIPPRPFLHDPADHPPGIETSEPRPETAPPDDPPMNSESSAEQARHDPGRAEPPQDPPF
ncbi:MAG: DUF222 domain-containing protein [Candidatus Nanopelagicales bacterium]